MMKRKLYGENIDKSCGYCEHGKAAPDGETVLCIKKGVVTPDFHCRRFKYDPLKRVPKRRPPLPEYSPEDFEL